MKIILTDKAPRPGGPYSQAIVEGGFVFASGQVPVKPGGGKYEPMDIGAETRQVLENLKAVLEAAGSSLDKVVKVTVFLRDIKDFAAMNEAYAAAFKGHAPARSTVQAGALPLGCAVEIDCIARA
jgi:2-iminobutanoate/2-iminopropanoate deaminase